ncbi:MAG: hypothetical protein HY927_01565 [Elusimicrobia bacterium]|nr:hypothetical protein [Elusimicrobiota bacterium]
MSLVLGIPPRAHANLQIEGGASEKDRQEFARIQTAFEEAANKKDFELLRPYLDKAFQGRMVSDEDVSGVEGLQAFWKKIGGVSEKEGVHRYTIRLNPENLRIAGNEAVAKGRTDEKFEVRPGDPVEFHSEWEVRLQKDAGGRWKLSSMNSRLDPIDKISLALKVTAKKLLGGALDRLAIPAAATNRLDLHKVRADKEQDFDGDRVRYRASFIDTVKSKAAPKR